jgi:hypothetical protein
VHVDFALGVAPFRAVLAQLARGLEGAQCFIPEHHASARFLPQALGKIVELLVAAVAFSEAMRASLSMISPSFFTTECGVAIVPESLTATPMRRPP